ncbi:hypothetical protein BDDG_07199 [Blastomyces dermatitidis ATCC 18188]|uniref:Uncharacterized protein n=1 Tax=Ajellomyces dermatitidis (strain ATCC 18188 / CBS 674.68) TaxID=653446 RepID=F2TLZ1_AJEDA|nr:hypothetical protein BDDG_07199 [Blastomyces dermatitidis ATCC 18188]
MEVMGCVELQQGLGAAEMGKHLCGAAAASVAAKKARLKVETVSMSCRSFTLIVTPSSTSLAAAVVLLVSASASGPSSAPLITVATPPPPSANTVAYDPVWSFREEPGESLISGTVALRSPIHSSSPAACLSPAQNAAGLSSQSLTVPLSSLCEKASVQSLASTATYKDISAEDFNDEE